MSTHHFDDVRLSLGAYTLGTLEPADEAAVEAHLASCPDCVAELAELDPVMSALALLTPEDMSPPAPSPELFDRIASAVDADSEAGAGTGPGAGSQKFAQARVADRRPPRWLLVAAAAVLLLTGAGTAVGIGVSSSSSRSATSLATGTSGPVELKVTAKDATAGTRLVLTAKGLPAHEHCTLVARAADGSLHNAGTWDATYEGKATVTKSTDVPRSRLRTLTLYGSDGHQLVTVDL